VPHFSAPLCGGLKCEQYCGSAPLIRWSTYTRPFTQLIKGCVQGEKGRNSLTGMGAIVHKRFYRMRHTGKIKAAPPPPPLSPISSYLVYLQLILFQLILNKNNISNIHIQPYTYSALFFIFYLFIIFSLLFQLIFHFTRNLLLQGELSHKRSIFFLTSSEKEKKKT